MIAVLSDAVAHLEQYRFATSRHERRLFHAARRWFLSDDTEWPFSFERICEVFDLDPSAVRKRLARRAGSHPARWADRDTSGRRLRIAR